MKIWNMTMKENGLILSIMELSSLSHINLEDSISSMLGKRSSKYMLIQFKSTLIGTSLVLGLDFGN